MARLHTHFFEPVVGSAFIKSDATAPDFDHHRFYLGTAEGRLVIVDASDLTNPRVVFSKKPEEIDPFVPRSRDIV
ncbi:MAG: hypothetical protein HPY90_15835 [Syntrophothermus sp.]|uniref:hypothetical protein n=1 Tax=Syntrophothermus sp. TaxID=2736299 RepID=UPI002580F629|nr:hypothetical protein [Syntrophothermus sp.]NSW84657.1 hypothetical protein [Syntrophothermus sp.]